MTQEQTWSWRCSTSSYPDEGSLTAMVYFEPDQVTRYQSRELTERYHRFAHRHRIELVGAYSVGALAAAGGRFDGSDFTAASGYDGPGAGVGNTVTTALESVVPAVFSEAGSAVELAQTGDLYEHARYQLARALGGARFGAGSAR